MLWQGLLTASLPDSMKLHICLIHTTAAFHIEIITAIDTKNGKERGNSYQKTKRSLEKRYTQTWKHNRDISMITDVFLDQKRVNMCSYTFSLLWSIKTSVIIRNLNYVSICLYVTFLWRSLHFLVRFFPFFPYFSTFLSTWSLMAIYFQLLLL